MTTPYSENLPAEYGTDEAAVLDSPVSGTLDTEAVYGDPAGGAIQVPHSETATTGTVDTTAQLGAQGATPPLPPAVTGTWDTSATAGPNLPENFTPVNTSVSGTVDTEQSSTAISGYPPYRAPNLMLGMEGAELDTTHTDAPVSSGLENPPLGLAPDVSGTLETAYIGAVPEGSTLHPAAPSAAPTVVAGDRMITVSWPTQPDPAVGAGILQYTIVSNTGGHIDAGRSDTSVEFTQVVPGQAYTFAYSARNRNGSGAYSPFSAPAIARNDDEVRPTTLEPYYADEPIYEETGAIDHGSAGAPTAPTGVTVVALAGTAGSATVTWTASEPLPSGGYLVKASSGQSVTALASATSAVLAGMTVAAHVTVMVEAVDHLQSSTSAPSASYTVV